MCMIVCVCVSQVVVWMMSSRESVDLKQTNKHGRFRVYVRMIDNE